MEYGNPIKVFHHSHELCSCRARVKKIHGKKNRNLLWKFPPKLPQEPSIRSREVDLGPWYARPVDGCHCFFDVSLAARTSLTWFNIKQIPRRTSSLQCIGKYVGKCWNDFDRGTFHYQSRYIFHVALTDQTRSIGCPLQCVIMHHHHGTICTNLKVHLYESCDIDSFQHGRDGILRKESPAPAMTNKLNSLWIRQWQLIWSKAHPFLRCSLPQQNHPQAGQRCCNPQGNQEHGKPQGHFSPAQQHGRTMHERFRSLRRHRMITPTSRSQRGRPGRVF
mmetsp:Transcript_10446/g.21044  ORF Transcript_10446/g.21044 Transcript_10446/m.21044 type:complete len:277 (+) Transcript_10446:1456-2286(+)